MSEFDRKTWVRNGWLQDWEYSDNELLERVFDLLVNHKCDPFNGRRKLDYDLQHTLVHVGDRCRILAAMRAGSNE